MPYGSIDSNVIEIDTLLLSEVSAAPEKKVQLPGAAQLFL